MNQKVRLKCPSAECGHVNEVDMGTRPIEIGGVRVSTRLKAPVVKCVKCGTLLLPAPATR